MRQLVLVSAIIAAFVLPATGRGQSMQEQLDELRRQVEELRTGQQQMTDLLTQIQSVLGGGARRAAPAARRGVSRAPQDSSDFDLTDVSVMWSWNAPVLEDSRAHSEPTSRADPVSTRTWVRVA